MSTNGSCGDFPIGKQHSLRTKDEAEALTLLHSKNEAYRQPVLNLQIARTYLTATDPEVANRTWQKPMDEMTKTKTGPTHARHLVANGVAGLGQRAGFPSVGCLDRRVCFWHNRKWHNQAGIFSKKAPRRIRALH